MSDRGGTENIAMFEYRAWGKVRWEFVFPIRAKAFTQSAIPVMQPEMAENAKRRHSAEMFAG
jgi:hypothetical protein